MTDYADEPTLDRPSSLFGHINLYAPDIEPHLWGQHPWLFKTLHGPEGPASGGLTHLLKPEHVMHAFHHPSLILDQHIWVEALTI